MQKELKMKEPSDHEVYRLEIKCVLANRYLTPEEKKKKVRQLIEQSGLNIEIKDK